MTAYSLSKTDDVHYHFVEPLMGVLTGEHLVLVLIVGCEINLGNLSRNDPLVDLTESMLPIPSRRRY